MTGRRPLDETAVSAFLAEQRAGWEAAGLTATRDGLTITIVGPVGPVGVIVPADRFPDLIEFRAFLTAGQTVPYPAGFLPPDLAYAQTCERRRWLPQGHPDYPTIDDIDDTETSS